MVCTDSAAVLLVRDGVGMGAVCMTEPSSESRNSVCESGHPSHPFAWRSATTEGSCVHPAGQLWRRRQVPTNGGTALVCDRCTPCGCATDHLTPIENYTHLFNFQWQAAVIGGALYVFVIIRFLCFPKIPAMLSQELSRG